MRAPRRPYRRIIYGERFTAVAWETVGQYERLYELVRWFELWLERDPGQPPCEEVEPGYWAVDSEAVASPTGPDIPRVTLIYRFDEEKVELWDMRVLPP